MLVDVSVPLSDGDRFLGAAVLDTARTWNFIKEAVFKRIPYHSRRLETVPVREFELGSKIVKVRRRARLTFAMESCAFNPVEAWFWVVPRRYAQRADILLGKKTILLSGLIRDNRIVRDDDFDVDSRDRSAHGVR